MPNATNAPGETSQDQVVDVGGDPGAAVEEVGHCPYRQVQRLQQALGSSKMRVGFLVGAGCGSAVLVTKDGHTRALVPDIGGLTSKVREELRASKPLGKAFELLDNRLKASGNASANIEELLTHLRTLSEVTKGGEMGGLSFEVLGELDREICKVTTAVVGVSLPDERTPFHILAAWIGALERNHPVEIFTPNYDLLLEQALEERRVPYFDGFIGSRDAFFDTTSMDRDKVPSRWARLWKIHGSVNWWRTAKGQVVRRPAREEDSDRQMIFPSHLKFDQSRRLPYLAMMDRFRAFLGSGQVVLVTCGYSFADWHINEVLMDGLGGNPNAVAFALMFESREKSRAAVENAKKQPNLSVLARDGAIVGTVEGKWRVQQQGEGAPYHAALVAGEVPESPRFVLGDFAALGRFLATQLADRSFGESEAPSK